MTVAIRALGVRIFMLSLTVFKTSGFEQLLVKTKGILSFVTGVFESIEFKIAVRSINLAWLIAESMTPDGYFCFCKRPFNSASRISLLFGFETRMQIRLASEYGMFVKVFRGWKLPNCT